MGQPSLVWEATATVVYNFFLTAVTALAALLQPFLPGADQVALVFALVMVRPTTHPGLGAFQPWRGPPMGHTLRADPRLAAAAGARRNWGRGRSTRRALCALRHALLSCLFAGSAARTRG